MKKIVHHIEEHGAKTVADFSPPSTKPKPNESHLYQSLEGVGGEEGPDPTFQLLFLKNPTSNAQFWVIPLPRRSQSSNPAPFFCEIPDLENTLPDPVIFQMVSPWI